jgi:site-specific DNA-methyltransferase (adenine-specific)
LSGQASFTLRGRNPDVLTCIANLSNDEVFTPPEFANRLLDTLAEAWAAENGGANIWADKTVRFLDPCTKAGVFLREITRRLVVGLAKEMPNIQERVEHILTQQVFGLAITNLTGLLSRRSVYCSKHASGPHSIVHSFANDDGNIWFERSEHTWANGKCSYCGASQNTLDRGEDHETHAYAFIHQSDINSWITEIFGGEMQFDVIIGNPPYQLNDGGGSGSSASPIYQIFVEQAKRLSPRFLTMIIPSRWFTGGKGLDEFRESMLSDGRIKYLDDYPISADVFAKSGPKGGVCFFAWDDAHAGDCRVTTHFQGNSSETVRPLLEKGADVFIRFNEGIKVLQKIAAVDGASPQSLALPADRRFDRLVSTRKPFGFASNYTGRTRSEEDDVRIVQKGGAGYVSRKEVLTGTRLIDSWKIFVGFAAPGTGDKDTYPHRIISTPFIGEPGEVSTETFLCIGPFETSEEAKSALSYLSCRLTRFLILLHKPSQNTTRHVYTFVPTQDWDKQWTDQELYAKYGITAAEQEFIEKVVRPMDLNLFGGPVED